MNATIRHTRAAACDGRAVSEAQMTHATGTREEWLSARLELLAREKELTRQSDELARQRRALPWVPVEKVYEFSTNE
jgi:predicted dithiol-disulfide oxidoreductase (DUF899 family)